MKYFSAIFYSPPLIMILHSCKLIQTEVYWKGKHEHSNLCIFFSITANEKCIIDLSCLLTPHNCRIDLNQTWCDGTFKLSHLAVPISSQNILYSSYLKKLVRKKLSEKLKISFYDLHCGGLWNGFASVSMNSYNLFCFPVTQIKQLTIIKCFFLKIIQPYFPIF